MWYKLVSSSARPAPGRKFRKMAYGKVFEMQKPFARLSGCFWCINQGGNGGWESQWNDINPGWWFGTFFIFPYIGNVIIPIDFHIFQRGSNTNQEWMNQWINEFINQWINEAVRQWLNVSTNQCTNESMNQWTNETMNQWTNESELMNPRISEFMNESLNGRMAELLFLVELVFFFSRALRWGTPSLSYFSEQPLTWATSFLSCLPPLL